MIEFVAGRLARKIPGEIVINVNGIGYKIYISLNKFLILLCGGII